MCQSKTRSLELHPVGGNVQVDDPDFFDMKAELDAAQKELREIREAIKANPEESTLDEVRRTINEIDTLKHRLIDIQNANKTAVNLYDESQKEVAYLSAHLKALIGEATKVVNYPSITNYTFLQPLKDLLSIPDQNHLTSHDAEVAAKAVLDYNLQLRKDIDDKLPMRCIGVHGDEYAAQLLRQVG